MNHAARAARIKLPRIIVVGRLVTRISLGIFFTHSASFAQISVAQSLNTEINGVRISADRRRVVTFKINDGQGRPLELSDLDDGSIRFTIAAIKAESNGQTSYQNYILTKVTGKEYVWLFVYQSGVYVLGYSYGYFQAKDFFKIAVALTLIEGVLLVLLVQFYWPLIGMNWLR